jgi:osmotically-inducible protein OsmY
MPRGLHPRSATRLDDGRFEQRSYENRLRRPELVGKGPRGYRASDERVKARVCERLSEGYLDASEIEVTVLEGAVLLAGIVTDRDERRLAEDLIAGLAGVRDVDNRLQVRKP